MVANARLSDHRQRDGYQKSVRIMLRPRTSAQTKEALQRLNSEHQVRRSRSVQPRSGFIGLPSVRQAEGASEGPSIRLRRWAKANDRNVGRIRKWPISTLPELSNCLAVGSFSSNRATSDFAEIKQTCGGGKMFKLRLHFALSVYHEPFSSYWNGGITFQHS